MIVFVCTGISIILNMTALFKLSKYDLRNKTNAMLLYQWMNELEMEQSRHSAQQLVQLLKTPDKTTHWALRRTHPNMTHHSFTLILLSGGVTASLLRWGTTQTLSSTSRQSAKHFKLQKNCKTDHFFITFPPPPPLHDQVNKPQNKAKSSTNGHSQCVCGRLAVNTASLHRWSQVNSQGQFVGVKMSKVQSKNAFFHEVKSFWGLHWHMNYILFTHRMPGTHLKLSEWFARSTGVTILY